MKFSLLTTILILSFASLGFCQQPPTVEEVMQVEPIWSYISEDTNFVRLDTENNFHVSRYSRQRYRDHIIDNGTLYLLEWFIQYGGLPSGDGYLLHAIDTESGIPKWVRLNNYFSGEKYVESSEEGYLKLKEDGNIIMHGFKSIDTTELDPGCIFCSAYVNPMNHHIDGSNGNLLEEVVDFEDTIRNDFKYLGYHSISNIGNEEQLKYYIRNELKDGFLMNILEIFHIDENAIVSELPVFEYEHNTNIPNGLLGFSYNNRYNQIDKDIGVALFGTWDPTTAANPTEIVLKYFNTSDPFEILEVKEIDLLPFINSDQNFGNEPVYLGVLEEEVILVQKVIISNEASQEKFYWFSRYDKFGNHLGTIERFQRNNTDYVSFSISEALGDIYLVARQNINSDTYDYFKWSKDGILTFIDSKQIVSQDVSGYNATILDINEENEIIMSVRVTYDGGFFFDSKVHYIAKFKGSDFGILSNIDNISSEKEIFIFPNPAFDEITFNKPISDYRILSASGNLISKGNLVTSISKIDISNLPNGFYYIHATYKESIIILPCIKYSK